MSKSLLVAVSTLHYSSVMPYISFIIKREGILIFPVFVYANKAYGH